MGFFEAFIKCIKFKEKIKKDPIFQQQKNVYDFMLKISTIKTQQIVEKT